MSTQDLQISLVGKDISASDSLRALARAANTAAKSAGSSLDEMNQRVKSSSDEASQHVTTGFGSKLSSWAGAGLAGILGGITSSVMSTVTNVMGDVGSAVVSQMKSSVIDYNSALENANIGFSTMLGSGKKAQEFLGQLQDFARTTPFEFGNLVSNAQQMMGMGIAAKDVIPDLRALGDSVASMGGSAQQVDQVTLAFDQMASKGTLDMGNMNQLLQGGVPSALKVLASSYGVTTGAMMKMISTGKVQSADALPRLVKGIESGTKATKGLGGMMDKQSATFSGAMSNISDAMQQTLSKAFLPFFKIAEKGAQALAKFAGSKEIQKWTKDVAASLKPLSGAFDSIKPEDMTNALGGVLDVVKELVKGLPKFVKGIKDMGPGILEVGKGLADFVGWLGDVASALSVGVTGFNKWVNDVRAMMTVWLDMTGHDISQVIGFFTGIPGKIAHVGGDIVNGLVNGLTGAWGAVTSTVQNLVNSIPLAVRKLLGIASPSKVFKQIGSWVGQGLQQGLLGSVDQIKSSSAKMADAITSQFKKGNISKASERYALDENSHTAKYLEKLANDRAKLQDKLSGLKADRSGVYNDTKSSTVAAGDVTGFGAPGDAVRGLQTLVANTRKFKTDLSSLVKKGIDQTTFGQLVSAWQSDPTSALASADGLLANPTDLKQIIGLQSQLASAGGSLGSYAAHHEYDSKVNATSGKIKVDTWQMQRVAAAATRTIAKAGDIHIHLTGTYAGTDVQLGKTVVYAIEKAEKSGQLSKNWRKG